MINAQEGSTQALRQWRFSSFEEIEDALIIQYVEEAMTNARAGLVMKPQKKELIIPPELAQEFTDDPIFKESFDSLTPGKQREYADYISGAKRAETKKSRLSKIKPMIEQGMGMMDKYK